MLGLDTVWWLVSPQNPLKPVKGMAPLVKRLTEASRMAKHPRIVVTDIEKQLHTQYTIDTIAALQKHFPSTRFVWLMGADNLYQVHRWHHWQEIFRRVPVAVLNRPPYDDCIQSCPALERFRRSLKPQEQSLLLKALNPPVWTILHTPLNAISATAFREKQKLRYKR